MASSYHDRDDDYPRAGSIRRLNYGSPGRRFLAAIIDGVILAVVGGIIGFIMGSIIGAMIVGAGRQPNQDDVFMVQVLGNIVGILIGWLYSAGLESSPSQATVGKMALGLIVTDLQGRRISFLHATGRHFAKIISGLICLIGFLMILFNNKHQGLHDQIAGCLVLEGKPGQEVPPGGWPDDDDRGPRESRRPQGEGITQPRDRIQE